MGRPPIEKGPYFRSRWWGCREDARNRKLVVVETAASAAPLETGLSCNQLSLPCRLRHDTDNVQRLEFKSLRQKTEQHSGNYIRAVAFVVLLYAHAKLGPLLRYHHKQGRRVPL